MKVVYPPTKMRESQVEKIMSKTLVTCNPNSTVLDVVKIMKNKHLRRVPVVHAKNKLVGLVTDFDLRCLDETLSKFLTHKGLCNEILSFPP